MNQYQQYQPNQPNPKVIRNIVLSAVAGIIVIIFLVKAWVDVGAGEAGVLFKRFSGGVELDQTFGEGVHLIAPWNSMYIYKVRQQELMEKMTVLSSNGLEITVDVSIWYQPVFSSLGHLHQEKGQEYVKEVVMPSIRSATRSVIGRYTPEEIYSSKRDAIQSEIFEETKLILDQQYVQLNAVLVRDIMLPPTIKTAIENKLKQEQASLEYEFKLQKEKKEAERIKIAAEGKAEANKILNASLTTNILKEKGIEATLELAKSPNSKIVVVGNSDGLPLILGNQ